MKLFLDFLPIVLFFIAFKWAGADPQAAQSAITPMLEAIGLPAFNEAQLPILLATVVAILATFLQVALQRVLRHPIEKAQWVGLALIVLFGGATLVFQDELFIKWKPTVLYWVMGSGFLVAHFFRKNPIKLMMGSQIELPAHAWVTLLFSWIVFFAIMGVVNLVVAYTFSTDFWVDFKLFGSLTATLAFVVGQGFYMNKHAGPEPEPSSSSSTEPPTQTLEKN